MGHRTAKAYTNKKETKGAAVTGRRESFDPTLGASKYYKSTMMQFKDSAMAVEGKKYEPAVSEMYRTGKKNHFNMT